MLSRPKYSNASFDRLKGLGEPKIKQIFSRVTLASQRVIAKALPSVSGFRPGSPASVERQVQNLVHRLGLGLITRTSMKSAEESGVYGFWRFYALEHLKPKAAVNKLLERLEKSSAEDSTVDAQLKSVREFLSTLVKAGEVARDHLVNFAEMAPFDDVSGLVSLAETANTEEEAKQASEIRALPTRLERDEHQIKTLEERLKQLEERVGSASYATKADVEDLLALSVAKEGMSALAERIAAIEQRPAVANTADDGGIQELKQDIQLVGASLDKLTRRVDDIEGNTLAALEWAERLEGLERRYVALEPKTVETPIAHRSDTAEERISELSDIPAALSALATGFGALGLLPSQASQLADEVIAAVACKQCVTFKGGMASKSVSVTAAILAGKRTREVYVTFGAENQPPVSPGTFDPPSGAFEASALIIRNANLAPAIVFADLVRQAFEPQVSECEPFIAVLATVTDTPVAFPLERLGLQLGPIFDTDLMDWKLLKAQSATRSSLALSCVQALGEVGMSKSPDTDEVRNLLLHAAPRRDPRFERNVLQGLAALSKIRPKQDGVTWQQSLCFGWIVPYWLIKRPLADDIDEVIDGGKCDADKPDPRLARTLVDLRLAEQE